MHSKSVVAATSPISIPADVVSPADFEALRRRMREAVAAQDYQLAAELQAQLRALGGEAAVGSNLKRQEPGRMGLGTSTPAHRKPEGWTPPRMPDLMTTNVKGRRGPRSR